MHYRPPRSYRQSIRMYVVAYVQAHASFQKFLGVVLDTKCNGIPEINYTLSAARWPANAIRRLANTKNGSSPATPLRLHEALVISRIYYGLPYLSAFIAQHLKIERVHRAGIKLALGVPRQTRTKQIYAETAFVPIATPSEGRALSQLMRLFHEARQKHSFAY